MFGGNRKRCREQGVREQVSRMDLAGADPCCPSPTEGEAPPPQGLFPTSCNMAARAPPPRALAPPPVPTETAGKEQVKMELENASLWKQFSAVGTEMIITKKGR